MYIVQYRGMYLQCTLYNPEECIHCTIKRNVNIVQYRGMYSNDSTQATGMYYIVQYINTELYNTEEYTVMTIQRNVQ